MATSDDAVRADGTNGFTETLASLSRYDLVLAVIPIAFITGVLVGNLLGLPTRTALVGGSLVGALALVDALFVNPPGNAEGP